MDSDSRESYIGRVALATLQSYTFYDRSKLVDFKEGKIDRLIKRDPAEYAEDLFLDMDLVKKVDEALDIAAKTIRHRHVALCIAGYYGEGYSADYWRSVSDDGYTLPPEHLFTAFFYDPFADGPCPFLTSAIVKPEYIQRLTSEKIGRLVADHIENLEKSGILLKYDGINPNPGGEGEVAP